MVAWPWTLAVAVLAVLAAASEQSDEHTWWQTKALETGESLDRVTPLEEAQAPPTLTGRRTIVGTASLAAEHGYMAENHTVRTADGYLLTLHRVANPGRPAVLLGHGLLGSSADFLVLGRGKALALILHDAGFDVWLLNARGTTPSRRHEHLSAVQSKFWDFSWHEIGTSDLPACIDYVLKASGQPQLHFVGYCQGATAFFVLGSERPEYMERVKTFVGLAPLAFPRDVRSFPLRLLAVAPNKLFFIMRLIGVNVFMPSSKLVAFLGEMLCADGEVYQPVCTNILFLTFGTDTEQMNTTVLPDFFANAPAGASSKQLLHYAQLMNHRRLVFRQFDYGRRDNLKRYHAPKPPEYNLSRVAPPSYLIYADNDPIAVQSNIEELSRRLPNIPEDGVRRVPFARFNHLDFILAKNAKELVYDGVIDILQRHEASSAPPAGPTSTAASSPGTTVTSTAPSDAASASTVSSTAPSPTTGEPASGAPSKSTARAA